MENKIIILLLLIKTCVGPPPERADDHPGKGPPDGKPDDVGKPPGVPPDPPGPPTSALEYCPQTISIDEPPLPFKDNDFPTREVKLALTSKSEEFRAYLELLEKESDNDIRDEENIELPYPDCLFEKQCTVRKTVVKKSKVPSNNDTENCWLIQPLIWTVCEDGVPDFQCVCETFTEIGFDCIQTYLQTPVWVYCDNGSIEMRIVNVPSGCSAQAYFCDPDSAQVCWS